MPQASRSKGLLRTSPVTVYFRPGIRLLDRPSCVECMYFNRFPFLDPLQSCISQHNPFLISHTNCLHISLLNTCIPPTHLLKHQHPQPRFRRRMGSLQSWQLVRFEEYPRKKISEGNRVVGSKSVSKKGDLENLLPFRPVLTRCRFISHSENLFVEVVVHICSST